MSKLTGPDLRPSSRAANSDTLPEPPLLTAEQLAPFLGTSAAQLAQQRFRGDGPPFVRTGSRSVRYRWSDVEAWLEANTRTQT